MHIKININKEEKNNYIAAPASIYTPELLLLAAAAAAEEVIFRGVFKWKLCDIYEIKSI